MITNTTLGASFLTGAVAGNTSVQTNPDNPLWLHAVVTLIGAVSPVLIRLFGTKEERQARRKARIEKREAKRLQKSKL